MKLVDLVFPGSARERAGLVATATGSGLASAFALMTINDVARTPAAATLGSFAFVVLLVVAVLAGARVTSHRMIIAIEASLHRIKARIVAKVEQAELDRIERIGPSEIFDRISTNLALISLAASQSGAILQSICVFSFSLLYLLWLSPSAFLVVVPLQLLAIWIYRSRQDRAEHLLQEGIRMRVAFFERLMGLLRGAKELKLNRARAEDALVDYGEASLAVQGSVAQSNHIWDDNILFMTSNLYVLLATVVFVFPQHFEVEPETLGQLVVAILFSWGSIQGGLVGYSMVVEANQALAAIEALEHKLDEHHEHHEHDSYDEPPTLAPDEPTPTQTPAPDPWKGRPGRLVARGLAYAYSGRDGEAGFGLGPIDLTIEPGEILFIVGGNGSGKSTLLKLLTGLYTPTRGTLELDGVPVRTQLAAYRERFSVIFSDHYLFSRPYGLPEPDPGVVRELLAELEIQHKTAFVRGRFTRRSELSSGQRKRLAMVLALLEDRPILVLDEWAADQDPQFRRHFYERFLPALKQRGKTVIAVSHDDRWFHCADRVVVMDYGRIR